MFITFYTTANNQWCVSCIREEQMLMMKMRRRRRKQKAQLFHFALIEQVLQADADDISTYKSDRKTRDLHLSLMTNAV